MIEPSVEIAYRCDFALLLNARGLTGVAVEVGTDMGEFASRFMERWTGRQLYCVDPYDSYPEMDRPRDSDRLMAINALQRFHPRVRFIESASPVAAMMIPPWDMPVDFAYIDGAHDHASVATDIATWWPMVKAGGVLAGHDFDPEHPGVMSAVREWSDANHVIVRTTPGERLASWYAYKGGEPDILKIRYFDEREISNPRRATQ